MQKHSTKRGVLAEAHSEKYKLAKYIVDKGNAWEEYTLGYRARADLMV